MMYGVSAATSSRVPATRPAHGRILLWQIHSAQNLLHETPCRCWVILRNVVRFCIQVGKRCPQPPNAHGETTSSPTLIDILASVANKKLIVWLNPLDATLTKNME